MEVVDKLILCNAEFRRIRFQLRGVDHALCTIEGKPAVHRGVFLPASAGEYVVF